MTNLAQAAPRTSGYEVLRTQHQFSDIPAKCITLLRETPGKCKLRNIILWKNATEPFKRVKIKKYKERLKDCFRLKETEETLQLNVFKDFSWARRKKIKLGVYLMKLLLEQLVNCEYVLWTRYCVCVCMCVCNT